MQDEDEFDAMQAGGEERPSRSARKRAALAAQKLGLALLGLKATELDALELPEELRTALAEARRLTSRAALARQRQYIGRLMRAVDPEPLERALAARPGQRPPRAKMPR
jgi:ribosome-associated protein